jgi:hypothetical protein
MSAQGITRTAMWTELLQALRKDFPDAPFPEKATPHVERFVRHNADYIFELTEQLKQGDDHAGFAGRQRRDLQ